jgi:hypothetical protein
MKTILNEKPFEYCSSNGTVFKADRCDFQGGVTATVQEDISREDLMTDVAGMVGFHATNIWSKLNGFQGYDCVRFVVEEEKYEVDCESCGDTGIIDAENSYFPCDCDAGATAKFNIAGVEGVVTGIEVRRHFRKDSPEPIKTGTVPIQASELPGRKK